MALPSGTVTFLFTDIEGSTRLWDERPEAMRPALARHDEVLRLAIEGHGGYVFQTAGDGMAAAFQRSADAVTAALDAQRALLAEPWPEGADLRVRMGLHTGEAEERDGTYFGGPLNRAARIMAAGHGGQVLLSATTAALVGGTERLADLGEHTFAGLSGPERVYQVGEGSFPPLRSLGGVPSNLPTERTAFVGRRQELAAVAGLVRSTRLVTLTGVGGVGKTRLAIHVAAGLGAEFPDGLWLAELAPLIDAALVPSSVASAIGASVAGGLEATDAVCRFLSQRRALLVLDNCEHVVDAAARLVDRLLATAPGVRILATSREPLDVVGESTWRVPSLSVEGDGGTGDAVELFTERAARVHSGLNLTDPVTREATVAVCRRLDGIPLAIELAAARARTLSVDEIAARLDERFRLLTRGGRTAVARQQTLRGAIDWSYELLAPPERSVFDSLGVFAGDFDLAAVVAVADLDEFQALDLVEQLVAKSTLEADPSRNRYRLLETLRQYAWDRLVATGRLTAVRDAHAMHFSALASEQARRMAEPGHQVAGRDRLEADYDNLRAALAWLIERHRADEAARLVRRLGILFAMRHPREGFVWFERVVSIAGDLPARSRAGLLGDAAFVALHAGERDAQVRYATAAFDVGGEQTPAAVHFLLGSAALRGPSHDYAAAAVHYRRAVDTAATTGDLNTHVLGMAALVEVAGYFRDAGEVRTLIPKAIELGERFGDPPTLSAAYGQAAAALARIGEPQEARVMFERGLAHADVDDPPMTTIYRGYYAVSVDDPYDAARIIQSTIPIARDLLAGDVQSIPLLVAAKVGASCGNERTAARLLGAMHYTGWMSVPSGHEEYERLVTHLRDHLGSATYEEEFRAGGLLSMGDALGLAEEILAAVA